MIENAKKRDMSNHKVSLQSCFSPFGAAYITNISSVPHTFALMKQYTYSYIFRIRLNCLSEALCVNTPKIYRLYEKQ